MDFDVKAWQALAKTDPAEFERRRVALLEELIASAPPDIQRRLRGTQFRVDAERQKSTNPLSATLRISRMMWESFSELREQLNQLAHPETAKPAEKSQSRSAEILPFKKPVAE